MAALPNTCGHAVVDIPKTETLAITKHLLSEHNDVTVRFALQICKGNYRMELARPGNGTGDFGR